MKGVHVLSWISGIFLLLGIFGCSVGQKWQDEKFSHRMKELDRETYETLANAGARVNFEALLDPMLIPRVPGTPNHEVVNKFIKDHMTTLGWALESDAFEEDTPEGRKPFENIMATLNPDVPRRLVLACHYDSKYTTGYEFIGATDSAVPCAMLLHLAYTMKAQLNDHKNSAQNVTLQFLFFDGEEAFRYWSSTDSLYGARHLASKWEQTLYPPNNRDSTTMLHRMDMMILLDLLGTSNVKFSSFFDETSHWHNALVKTEQQLKRSNFWSGSTRSGAMFQGRQQYGGIEDDHVPFLQRGVDILHVIPSPFPSVWHTQKDNKEALDFPTIENLNRIFRLFVARYLWGTQGPTNIVPTSIRPPLPQTSSSNSVSSVARPGPLQNLLMYFFGPFHRFFNRKSPIYQ